MKFLRILKDAFNMENLPYRVDEIGDKYAIIKVEDSSELEALQSFLIDLESNYEDFSQEVRREYMEGVLKEKRNLQIQTANDWAILSYQIQDGNVIIEASFLPETKRKNCILKVDGKDIPVLVENSKAILKFNASKGSGHQIRSNVSANTLNIKI